MGKGEEGKGGGACLPDCRTTAGVITSLYALSAASALAVGSETLVSHNVIPLAAALDGTEAAPDDGGKPL